MKVALLAGGISPERHVSLASAALIKNALTANGHRVALLDLCKSTKVSEELFDREKQPIHNIDSTAPSRGELDMLREMSGSDIGEGIIDICRMADVVFLALHGGVGENGQLQATLDAHGIHRYTGSRFTGSLLAMDKDISKILFRRASIPTPDWIMLEDKPSALDKAESRIGYPCVIKPNKCGSSVGVSIAKNREELRAALDHALSYDERIMCEKHIRGRELTVGILDKETLCAIEMIPHEGFYDYKNKYIAGATLEICPAQITGSQYGILADMTKRGFEALQLSSYARFDFILSDDDGCAYCLEANTLPGMTPTSLLPQMAEAAGIGYGELCERICMLARNEG